MIVGEKSKVEMTRIVGIKYPIFRAIGTVKLNSMVYMIARQLLMELMRRLP